MRSYILPAMVLVLGVLPAQAGEDTVRVTREIKSSIEMAQRYMASQQRSDGSYSGDNGQLTGIVASCTLAFMATGSLPGEGPFARQVSRGIQFILNNAQPSGLLLGDRRREVVVRHRQKPYSTPAV